MKYIQGGVCAPQGFTANGVHCGIRKNKSKLDLGLILSEVKCSVGAVYTQNKVKGAPIIVTKSNISDGIAQAVICNSGNANTCNADGIDKANMMCFLTASALGIDSRDVIVASTGVIGQPLPIEPIASAIDGLAKGLAKDGSDNMSQAILTTDTVKKEYAIEFELDGKKCVIGAIAKGSGMIHPNMATMLCFATTDVAITSKMLQTALKSVVDDTINMVSVDGDTSTNDTMTIMANGLADNSQISTENTDYYVFLTALKSILTAISKDLAKDGEGATKLLECRVSGAKSKSDARAIAKSVITSSLFKAAMFASDANWGRILCAIGYADADFDITKVDVDLQSSQGVVKVCKQGSGVEFDEDYAYSILQQDEIIIDVKLGDGAENAVAWGCDLTYEYVKINAEYRS